MPLVKNSIALWVTILEQKSRLQRTKSALRPLRVRSQPAFCLFQEAVDTILVLGLGS